MFELRKIGIVKRLSAWFLDAILLAVLTTGFMFLIVILITNRTLPPNTSTSGRIIAKNT